MSNAEDDDKCPKCGSTNIGGSVDIGIMLRCDSCGHLFNPSDVKKEDNLFQITILCKVCKKSCIVLKEPNESADTFLKRARDLFSNQHSHGK